MSRPLTILLAVLSAGAVVAAVLVVGPASSSSSATTERTVTATKGVVQKTVSGSGNLAPAKELDLNFGVSGTVSKVYVKAGDTVKQGQVLARLDDADGQVAVDQAQAALDSAQADLEAAQNETVAATAEPVAQTTTTPQTGSAPAQTQSQEPSSSGSTQTAAQKAAAIATAQAAVDKAQLDVQDAEQDVADTVLRAPTKGTVTAVTGAAGDDVSAGASGATTPSASTGSDATGTAAASSSSGAFITLAKLDRMQLSVSFTESDIGQVKVGQAATVSLSALSDVKLSGKVTQVAQVGTSSSGVVSYPVTIVLDQNARGVKAGMTASAEVIVQQASGLTLPSQAVTGRGTSGIVQVEQDGETVSKRVGIGLQGDSSTIITSGLEAGDEVVIQSTPAITGGGATGQQGSGALSRSGLGGAGGGFPGGGFPGGGTFTPPSGGGFQRPGG